MNATAPSADCHALDFGLHVNPEALKRVLQEAEMILLGYDPCSQAVVGPWANDCMAVTPKTDDCIATTWSSRGACKAQLHTEPGTYHLTKREPQFQHADQKNAARPRHEESIVACPGETISHLDSKRAKGKT